MKKILKWIGGIFIAIVIIGIFADPDGSKISANQEVIKPENTKISITDNGYKIIELLVAQDVSLALKGDQQTLLKSEYMHTTATQMQKTYSQNEARGDQTYNDKKIIITGRVQSIDSTIGNEPVVRLKSNDSFNSVMLYYKKGFKHLAADLNKNQQITLACIGYGSVIGSPVLKKCEPVENVKLELINSQMKHVNNYLKGRSGIPEDIEMVTKLIIAISDEYNDFKDCEEINLQCIEKLFEAYMEKHQ